MVKMENLKTILATLLLIMAMSTEGRQPVLHRVGGGRFTWKPNVNFTEWAIHEQFYVGDWLYFGFDRQLYSVLQVNKTSYYKCIEQNFINNITRGGRDVFNLTEAKPYYFISGRGYCFKGMKVAVNVQEYSTPTTNGSLPITISSSASNFPANLILPLILSCSLAWILTYTQLYG